MKTCSEISREIGCSRANVGQTLKRGLTKVYKKIKEKNISESPYERFEIMVNMFNLYSQEDINDLYSDLPFWIKEEIKNDATKNISL